MSLYSSVVLADNPSSYYRLGDAVGATTAADAKGAVTGTVAGGVTFGQPGLLDYDSDTAALFNGTTGNISLGDNYDFAGTVPFTLEAIIRVGTGGIGAARNILNKTDGVDGWNFAINATGQLVASRRGGGADTLTGTTVLVEGTEYHVAVTYDSTTLRLYVNGVLEASLASSRSQNNTALTLRMGANSAAAAAFWSGVLDEVAIYATALAETRIVAHYLASLSQADFPDWQTGVTIVGANVTIPINIVASGVTIPISIVAASVEIDINIANQTVAVNTGSQYGAIIGQALYLGGVAGTVDGAILQILAYIVPVGKTFYMFGYAFGWASLVVSNSIVSVMNVNGVPRLTFVDQAGASFGFDTPVVLVAGDALSCTCQHDGDGAVAALNYVSAWGILV